MRVGVVHTRTGVVHRRAGVVCTLVRSGWYYVRKAVEIVPLVLTSSAIRRMSYSKSYVDVA